MMRKIEYVGHVHRRGSRWAVAWAADGRKHSFSRIDRAVVEERRAELLAEIVADAADPADPVGCHSPSEPSAIPALPSHQEGTAQWWAQLISDAAKAAHGALAAGDVRQLELLRKFARTAGELGRAAVPHLGYAEQEAEHRELVLYVESVQQAKASYDDADGLKPECLRSPASTLKSSGPAKRIRPPPADAN